MAQTTQNNELLVKVFEKCQIRTDEKLKDYKQLINKVKEEVNNK